MLLTVLLLNLLLLCLSDAGTVDQSSQKQGFEDLENFVENLVEARVRNIVTMMEDEKEKQAEEKRELEAKIKEMEIRLETKDRELEKRLEELESHQKQEKGEFEAPISSLKKDVDESLRNEIAYNRSYYSNIAVTKPSLRDLPIVLISAYQGSTLRSPQTVTFESFLANFNNGDRQSCEMSNLVHGTILAIFFLH